MPLYDLKLAAASLTRDRLLAAATIGAIAIGMGVFLVAMTLYYTLSGNPLEHKNDSLYAITLDSKSTDPVLNRYDAHPAYPPYQLTYRDALELYRSDIPSRKTIMYRASGAVDPRQPGVDPFQVSIRLATADFFAMFDAPFRYGAGWSRDADAGPEPAVVIGRLTNERAFRGANSVGQVIAINGRDFRVTGVLAHWMPRPRVYDVNTGAFDLPEDVFIPFQWGEQLGLTSTGNTTCMRQDIMIRSFRDRMESECVWIQAWAQLEDRPARERFQQAMDAYVADQKKLGRFPRPLNNRLVPVDGWLQMNDVVAREIRIILVLAILFLAVCVFNSVGLVLAKFLHAAQGSGVRRALGASRWDIFRGHIVELALTGFLGGVIGLVLSYFGLLWLHRLVLTTFLPQADRAEAAQLLASIMHLDLRMVCFGLGLSVLAGLAAGLYPAWRVCRVSPGAYLKVG